MHKSLASFAQSLDIVELSFNLRMYIRLAGGRQRQCRHETIIEYESE